jgi:hypothetical protein
MKQVESRAWPAWPVPLSHRRNGRVGDPIATPRDLPGQAVEQGSGLEKGGGTVSRATSSP